MYKRLVSLLLICLTVLLAGCAASKTPNDVSEPVKKDESSPPQIVSISANPIGQTAYQWAAAISDLINKSKLNIESSAEETKGYLENARLMIEGQVEFGFVNNMMLEEAYNATGGYKGMSPNKVMAVMAISPTEQHIIKLKGGNIASVKDFKGKRVGLGQPGGVSLENALRLIEALDLKDEDFKGIKVNLAEQCDMLRNNQIDVAIWIGSIPLPAITELATTKEIEFLPIPDDISEKLIQKYPVYELGKIPADTYKGQTEDIPTYVLQNTLAVNADIPEETVYQVTKLIMENIGELSKMHPGLGSISKETVLNGLMSPLHPGAQKYYEEIDVPGIERFSK